MIIYFKQIFSFIFSILLTFFGTFFVLDLLLVKFVSKNFFCFLFYNGCLVYGSFYPQGSFFEILCFLLTANIIGTSGYLVLFLSFPLSKKVAIRMYESLPSKLPLTREDLCVKKAISRMLIIVMAFFFLVFIDQLSIQWFYLDYQKQASVLSDQIDNLLKDKNCDLSFFTFLSEQRLELIKASASPKGIITILSSLLKQNLK